METVQTTNRIHPLIAGAAVSVTLVSLLGAAAIAGILPNSHGNNAPSLNPATPALAAAAPVTPAPVATPVQTAETEPAAKTRTVVHKKVVYRTVERPAPQYAQAAPNYGQPYPQPAAQQAAQPVVQQHSAVGIATGAVIGGLLGNQVGGGNGKTLATVAGAIGGGYLGNEVGKKYGY